MSFITKNILNFYKTNEDTNWYLQKYFANSGMYGHFSPFEKNPIRTEWDKKSPFIATIDEHTVYNINKFGLRGKIDKNSDVLASGCSLTFGIGVPEEGRWSNILGNKINKDITNLGNPGASVETTCSTIIQYCMNNKMPSEIFCLMPDFFRSRVVADRDFLKQKHDNKRIFEDDLLNLEYCSPEIILHKDLLVMEVEDQKYIEDATSPHQLILNAINSIYFLESFCSTNNIKLHWTTWDLASQKVMEELLKVRNFKLKQYTPFFPKNCTYSAGDFVINTCHLSHNSEFKDHRSWLDGADYSIREGKKTKRYCHPGIHLHTHVAEFFNNLRNKDHNSV